MPNNNPQQSTSPQSSQRSEGSQKISERVERTADQASRLADRLGESAEQTANAALQRVRDARLSAQSGLEEQRERAAERIRRLSDVLRAGSETLSTDDPYAHNLLSMASDRVERVADYVSELEPSRIAEDLHALARRRPGLFFGGAFLLGLGLGRFVKSTGSAATGMASRTMAEEEDYGESSYETDYQTDYQTSYESSSYREPPRSYVATQREIGVGESPTTGGSKTTGGTATGGTARSGSSASGSPPSTTLPYGVGGSSGSSGTSQATGGTGSSSAFGAGASSDPSRNVTSTNTPRETERGQGSKS